MTFNTYPTWHRLSKELHRSLRSCHGVHIVPETLQIISLFVISIGYSLSNLAVYTQIVLF